MSTQEVREEVLLNIRCIVKGYHLCRFEANVDEVFTPSKRRDERGNAFKVVNHRGQLGHLQSACGHYMQMPARIVITVQNRLQNRAGKHQN